MSRLLLIAVLGVAGLLEVACTSDKAPAATATTATASVTATPRALVTAMPSEEAAATAVPPDIGVAVMDAATGEMTELYRGSEWMLNGMFYPQFVGDESAVWISVESWQEARRFAPNGELLFTVDGWGAIESEDGRSRSYFLFDDDGQPTRDVVVERGSVRHAFEGQFARRTFSPDGTLIALEEFGEESLIELSVLDIESGELRVLATEIGACQCDGGPSPRWSPSGDYLAYIDFDVEHTEEPGEQYGSFVADMESGDIVQLAWRRAWFPAGWGVDDTISYRDGLELWEYHARTGVRELIVTAPEHGSGSPLSETYIVIDESSGGSPWSYETALIDRASGEEIARWPEMVELTLTATGVEVIARTDSPMTGGCIGVWVDHPQLDEPLCFKDANWWARWSADASKIAVLRRTNDGSSLIEVFDFSSGESVVSEPIDANISSIGWNDAGTYVVVSWGTGV